MNLAEISDKNIKQVLEYSWRDVNSSMDGMRSMFDLVRLVDAEECREIFVDKGRLSFGNECFAVWGADHRCANCTSFKACHTHQRKNRLEYYGEREYQIQSIPVRITMGDESVYSCTMELINFAEKDERISDGIEKDEIETKGYISTHDGLTGLLNWDGFCREARGLILANPGRPAVMIAANIQDFKLVNSLFGRNKGDEILIEISNYLKNLCQYDAPEDSDLSKAGVCSRAGADNFAVCLIKTDGLNERIEKIVESVKGLIDSPVYRLNIHFGVCEVDNDSLPISILYDRAYMAMQTIQNQRETNMAFFDEEMLKSALHEQAVISDFEHNLQSGQFVIFLQPQVNKDGRIAGAECLVRWVLPDGKMIPPFEFIGILEQSDLIASLDKYVWELAARQLHDWQGTPFSDIYLSINVSPKDFFYVNVSEELRNLCDKYSVPPKMLHVEITETAVADETQNNKATIEELQRMGFLVEIDDFGKGSSSLSLLTDIKANVLKIDMGFLRQSENNERGNVILEFVIDMAKRLGMEVISEGVETEEQLQNLARLGCDTFQGYYFSKPIPVAAFEKMVAG